MRKRNVTSKEHDPAVPSRRFMKHLGRHLEEIALFVVPQPEEDEIDLGDIGSNSVHAAQDEDIATNSTLSSFNSDRPSERSSGIVDHGGTGDCSTCGNTFSTAQPFYDHLDNCVLSVIQDQVNDDPATADNTEDDSHNADETANEEYSQGDRRGLRAFLPPKTQGRRLGSAYFTTAYSDDARLHSSGPSSQYEQDLQQQLE